MYIFDCIFYELYRVCRIIFRYSTYGQVAFVACLFITIFIYLNITVIFGVRYQWLIYAIFLTLLLIYGWNKRYLIVYKTFKNKIKGKSLRKTLVLAYVTITLISSIYYL